MKMLKDHPDPLPGQAQILRLQSQQILPIYYHTSRLRPLQQINHTNQRALPGPTVADNAVYVSRVNLQADILNGCNRL
ncbi:hypothetical protein PbJCM17693_01660 [Paenibacillus macerans]|nr:hypothetical protein PbJCM17693_01660 [Paenibacillus macerans]